MNQGIWRTSSSQPQAPAHGSRLPGLAALIAVAISLFLLAASIGVGSEGAVLLRSDPPPNVVLPQAPIRIDLRFDQGLNATASRILVWNRFSHLMNQGDAVVVPGGPPQLQVRLNHLAAGSYRVSWLSVAAGDGQVQRGTFTFSVKVRGALPPMAGATLGPLTGTQSNTTGWSSLLAHWVELMAALVWLGAVGISVFPGLPPEVRASLRRFSLASIVLLVVASCLVVLLQVLALSGGLWTTAALRSAFDAVLAGQFFHLWVARQAIAILAGLAVFGTRLPASPDGEGEETRLEIAVALGVVYLYFLAVGGAGRSGTGGGLLGSPIVSLSVLLSWLHGLAGSVWLGAQLALALALFRRPDTQRGGNSRAVLDALSRSLPVLGVAALFFLTTDLLQAAMGTSASTSLSLGAWGWVSVIDGVLVAGVVGASAVVGRELRLVFGDAPARSDHTWLERFVGLLSHQQTGWAGRRPNGYPGRPLHENAMPIGAASRRLARWRLQSVLGAGLLFASSAMILLPASAHSSVADRAVYAGRIGTMNVTLAIMPNHAGTNSMTISLLQGRIPVSDAQVVVLPSMLVMVMSAGLSALPEVAPGKYSGVADLAMGGRWRVQVIVKRGHRITRASVVIRVLI